MALSNAGISNLAGAGRLTELRQRIFFVIMVLVVYRVGTFIPLPGIDVNVMRTLFTQHSGGILGMMNMFSGGALSRMSLFALGVMPYISASIIVQLLSSVLPALSGSRKKVRRAAGRSRSTPVTVRLVLAWFRHWVFPLLCRGSLSAGKVWCTHRVSAFCSSPP